MIGFMGIWCDINSTNFESYSVSHRQQTTNYQRDRNKRIFDFCDMGHSLFCCG